MTSNAAPQPPNSSAQGSTRKPTGRPSKSYLRFERVMKRALDLVALQNPIEKLMAIKPTTPEQPCPELSDMSRAAIVLAVAAMDSYFTDVFAERFVPFLKKNGPTKEMVAFLEKAGLDTECALQLLAMKRPFRRIRTLIETHLERRTTQKVAVIDDLFLIYGLKGFSLHVQKLTKRKKLIARIDSLVKRRNKIAHEGDVNSHGKVVPLDPAKAKRGLQHVLAYVSGADELLHKRVAK
jgi:hypothetical protein